MKTFQEFITEARGKFRGHRTPEEIAKIRKEREERQSIEPHDTPVSRGLTQAAAREALKQIKQKNQLKGTLLTRMRFYQGRPAGLRDTTLDTTSNVSSLTKRFSRARNILKKQKEDKHQVLPSQHPDANFSSPEAAKKADKTHQKRVKERRRLRMPSRQEYKAKQREAEKQSRENDRRFRRTQLKDTVGKIPGQLS